MFLSLCQNIYKFYIKPVNTDDEKESYLIFLKGIKSKKISNGHGGMC